MDQSAGWDLSGGNAAAVVVVVLIWDDTATPPSVGKLLLPKPAVKLELGPAATAVDDPDWEALNGVDTEVGKEALDDNVEGDL